MNENDKLILRKLFILLDYALKTLYPNDDEEFSDAMFDKVQKLKTKLSFKYRKKDEVALRYLASKSRLIW